MGFSNNGDEGYPRNQIVSVVSEFKSQCSKMRRIALVTHIAWWLPEFIVKGSLDLDEVVLYFEPRGLSQEFEKEKPANLIFTDVDEDSEGPSKDIEVNIEMLGGK